MRSFIEYALGNTGTEAIEPPCRLVHKSVYPHVPKIISFIITAKADNKQGCLIAAKEGA